MSPTRRRSRSGLAPLLLALALAGAVGPYLGHHHEGPWLAAEVGRGVLYSAGALHPEAPVHLDGVQPIEVGVCAVCVLRAQSRDCEVPGGAVGVADAEPSRGPTAGEPRIAGLEGVGPPGSRGPPSLPAVS